MMSYTGGIPCWHAAMIWWPILKCKTSQTKLSKLQKLACLGITDAMTMAPTATI